MHVCMYYTGVYNARKVFHQEEVLVQLSNNFKKLGKIMDFKNLKPRPNYFKNVIIFIYFLSVYITPSEFEARVPFVAQLVMWCGT